MNVNFIVNDKPVAASAQLAGIFAMLFMSDSASAKTPGEDRKLAAKVVSDNLNRLPKFQTLVIETDEKRITILAANLPAKLAAIQSAVTKNDAFRESVKAENAIYDEGRTVEMLVAREGKGRKSTDKGLLYASAFAE